MGEDGWQSLVKHFPALHSTTSHAGCQTPGLLHTLGSWCVPGIARAAVGDTTTSSGVFDNTSVPQWLSFCSTQKLSFEDAKLPVKHSLDYPGFIPAP